MTRSTRTMVTVSDTDGAYSQAMNSNPIPVVFVPAAAGTAEQWREQLEHLGRTRKAVVVEMRARDRAQTVEQFAEDLGGAVDELGFDRFVMVGHSFGGAVCAAYAARQPDRVAGLLLIDPASDGRLIPPEMAAGYLQALGDERQYLATVEAYWAPMLADSRPEVRERVLGDLRSASHDTVYATLNSLLAFDPVAALEAYRGPRRSVITRFNEEPGSYQNLVKALPFEKIDGVGHWLQLDAPEKVKAAIDRFLATT